MTCIICGAQRPANRQKYCCDRCEAEGNRRNAAERYRREVEELQLERKAKLPAGKWFRCVYDGEDNDSILPHHTYAREAVRDFVANGDPVEWYQPVG